MTETANEKELLRQVRDLQKRLDDALKVADTERQIAGFYKYKYKLAQIANLNRHGVDNIQVEVRHKHRVWRYDIPKSNKIISLKTLISREAHLDLATMKLSYQSIILENGFTLADYLISNASILYLAATPSHVVVNDTPIKITDFVSVGDLKAQLDVKGHLIDQNGQICADTTLIQDLDPELQLRSAKYSIEVSSQVSDQVVYVNSLEEIKGIRPYLFIADDLELIEGCRLQMRPSQVDVTIESLNLFQKHVQVPVAISKTELRELYGLADSVDFEFEETLMKESLEEFVENPHIDQKLALCLSEQIPIEVDGKSETLTKKFHLTLQESCPYYHFAWRKNNKIMNTPKWSDLKSIKFAHLKLTILDFDYKQVGSWGVGKVDLDKDFLEFVEYYDKDLMIYDNERFVLVNENGDDTQFRFGQGRTVSEVVGISALSQMCEIELRIMRKIKLVPIMNRDAEEQFYYNCKTSISELRDQVFQLNNDNGSGSLRVLEFKKSSGREGYINLNRFYSYELVVNCVTDPSFDVVYYYFTGEAYVDQTPLYVVEYAKGPTDGRVEGVVKRYLRQM